MDKDSIVDELRALQGDRCGICGERRELQIDHDHISGFVRGLLCQHCNTHEGQHGACLPAAECPVCLWRKVPATAYLGWTVRYTRGSGSPFGRPRRGGYVTTVARAVDARASRRDAAEAIARMYRPESAA